MSKMQPHSLCIFAIIQLAAGYSYSNQQSYSSNYPAYGYQPQIPTGSPYAAPKPHHSEPIAIHIPSDCHIEIVDDDEPFNAPISNQQSYPYYHQQPNHQSPYQPSFYEGPYQQQGPYEQQHYHQAPYQQPYQPFYQLPNNNEQNYFEPNQGQAYPYNSPAYGYPSQEHQPQFQPEYPQPQQQQQYFQPPQDYSNIPQAPYPPQSEYNPSYGMEDIQPQQLNPQPFETTPPQTPEPAQPVAPQQPVLQQNENDYWETRGLVDKSTADIDVYYQEARQEIDSKEAYSAKENRDARTLVGRTALEGQGMLYGSHMEDIMTTRDLEVDDGVSSLLRFFRPPKVGPSDKPVSSVFRLPFDLLLKPPANEDLKSSGRKENQESKSLANPATVLPTLMMNPLSSVFGKVRDFFDNSKEITSLGQNNVSSIDSEDNRNSIGSVYENFLTGRQVNAVDRNGPANSNKWDMDLMRPVLSQSNIPLLVENKPANLKGNFKESLKGPGKYYETLANVAEKVSPKKGVSPTSNVHVITNDESMIKGSSSLKENYNRPDIKQVPGFQKLKTDPEKGIKTLSDRSGRGSNVAVDEIKMPATMPNGNQDTKDFNQNLNEDITNSSIEQKLKKEETQKSNKEAEINRHTPYLEIEKPSNSYDYFVPTVFTKNSTEPFLEENKHKNEMERRTNLENEKLRTEEDQLNFSISSRSFENNEILKENGEEIGLHENLNNLSDAVNGADTADLASGTKLNGINSHNLTEAEIQTVDKEPSQNIPENYPPQSNLHIIHSSLQGTKESYPLLNNDGEESLLELQEIKNGTLHWVKEESTPEKYFKSQAVAISNTDGLEKIGHNGQSQSIDSNNSNAADEPTIFVNHTSVEEMQHFDSRTDADSMEKVENTSIDSTDRNRADEAKTVKNVIGVEEIQHLDSSAEGSSPEVIFPEGKAENSLVSLIGKWGSAETDENSKTAQSDNDTTKPVHLQFTGEDRSDRRDKQNWQVSFREVNEEVGEKNRPSGTVDISWSDFENSGRVNDTKGIYLDPPYQSGKKGQDMTRGEHVAEEPNKEIEDLHHLKNSNDINEKELKSSIEVSNLRSFEERIDEKKDLEFEEKNHQNGERNEIHEVQHEKENERSDNLEDLDYTAEVGEAEIKPLIELPDEDIETEDWSDATPIPVQGRSSEDFSDSGSRQQGVELKPVHNQEDQDEFNACLMKADQDIKAQALANEAEGYKCINDARAIGVNGYQEARKSLDQDYATSKDQNQANGERLMSCASAQWQLCAEERAQLKTTVEAAKSAATNDVATAHAAQLEQSNAMVVCNAKTRALSEDLRRKSDVAVAVCKSQQRV